MILESIEPRGKFIKVLISDERLVKYMEKKHSKICRRLNVKFFFLPQSYVIRNDKYYIFIEMYVYLKAYGGQDYYFVAENMLAKFDQA